VKIELVSPKYESEALLLKSSGSSKADESDGYE
jgi:hypothetical protein